MQEKLYHHRDAAHVLSYYLHVYMPSINPSINNGGAAAGIDLTFNSMSPRYLELSETDQTERVSGAWSEDE